MAEKKGVEVYEEVLYVIGKTSVFLKVIIDDDEEYLIDKKSSLLIES